MQPKPNGSALAYMRSQGLDKNGQPISSYWKARIESEEGRVRVLELEGELQKLKATRPVVDPAQVANLKAAVTEAERSKMLLSSNFQKRMQESQLALQKMRKEASELSHSRDRWKAEALALKEAVQNSQAAPATGSTEVVPLPAGVRPSIQDLFVWMGVYFNEGRVLAVGEDSGSKISIEVKDSSLIRVTEPSPGVRRVFRSVPLTDPVSSLFPIFIPYRSYLGFQTDPSVLEIFRMIGRPLNIS